MFALLTHLRDVKGVCVCVCVSGVEVGTPTHFTIYTKGAGKAKPEVHFAASRPGEAVRDFEIIDNHDYSYTVKYTALQQVEQTSAVNPALRL